MENLHSYDLSVFLVMVVGISLSGVLAPGPVTVATLAAGTRSKHAGVLIAIGHGIVEFPLLLLIMAGMSTLFQSSAVRIGIGIIGGLVLLLMGLQMLRDNHKAEHPTTKYGQVNPLWLGVALSGGNPYFLIWWATVGLTLASQAWELGEFAFAMFAIIHWLCDLVWLELLSQAGYRGSKLLSPRGQRFVLVGCAAVLLLFGSMFIYDAAGDWLKLASSAPPL